MSDENAQSKRLTRGKAIRLKCIDCMCGNTAEVRRCPCADCPLYRYRLGREDSGVYADTHDSIDDENGDYANDLDEQNESEDDDNGK